jgi:hypothetical protein
MLIDATHCCDDHANQAVDDLFAKAASDPPDGDIWSPHHSPFLMRLIELFTERGLLRIGSLQLELQKWIDGEMHRPGPRPETPPGYIPRWTPGELAIAKLYLETLPPAEFTIDDWMLCIDWLHERYFPAEQLWPEAEWMATKSSIMGRVQARMDAAVSLEQADALIAAAPATVAATVDRFGMTAAQSAMMRYGRARCAENISTMADGLRRRAKAVVLEYQKGVALGDPTIRESLQTRLSDAFGQANVDWRRIALTEAAENQLQGMILALKPGARVRRIEQYRGACSFCRKIDGMEFEVVSPSDPDKDDWKHVWPGKTNVGRSAAPRKRVGGELIDRSDAEMWAPAAGVQHPHCRGTWIELNEPDSAGDPEFTAWMRGILEKKE